MTQRPKKICNKPGCSELTTDKYCETHAAEIETTRNKYRTSSHARGYNYKWQIYRKGFLRKNPLCIFCLKENRYKPATVVDHVIPHKGDMKLFWDKTNHQSLCKMCHDKKTAREDGAFNNNIR